MIKKGRHLGIVVEDVEASAILYPPLSISFCRENQSPKTVVPILAAILRIYPIWHTAVIGRW